MNYPSGLTARDWRYIEYDEGDGMVAVLERPKHEALPVPVTVYLRLEDVLRVDAYAEEAGMTSEDFLEAMVLVGLTTHETVARHRAERAE